MNERIKHNLDILLSGEYKLQRKAPPKEKIVFPSGTSEAEMNSHILKFMCDNERPVFFGIDRFGFNRTLNKTPIGVLDGEEHNIGIGNITPDYPYVLSVGMDKILLRIEEKLLSTRDEAKHNLYKAMRDSVVSALSIADKYRDYAKKMGREELYLALCQVPHGKANSFYEALVFLKFIQFSLRLNRNSHITLGGFDKYMLPYFEADIAAGVSEDDLFELLEDFFITLNFDTDTYFGVQQGDSGLSMVLGGIDIDGNDRYNKLSELCIKASIDLCLIDPKINLRIDKNTPIERLEFATELTKKGLGFPQYSNDDVVIPGLIKHGYAPEDAYDYTVAACWEFITPGKSYDIPNMDKVNFPRAVERAVNCDLLDATSFEDFFEKVKKSVLRECDEAVLRMKTSKLEMSPYLSVFVKDCIERGLDVSEGGAIYNNYGAHGVGISNAADAIAAVKKCIFEDKKYTKGELLEAIRDNFENHSEIRNYLLTCPKMGNNDDSVDAFAAVMMDIFVNSFKKGRNYLGGILRPGTGSAMEYLWSASVVGATADGRYAKTPFGSSFSPSPIARLNGPLSCIQSFTKYDFSNIINGGPLTMEIHDTTFRNSDGVKKVAALVKAFVDLGGHQLQLNSINREVLLDAQAHPELHKNLIVRVWGWSGYFNELAPEYQEHIIRRTEFTV